MSISTYTELQTAIANYLGRSDLADRIKEFITAAEIRLQDDVKVRAMEDRAFSESITSSTTSVSLPADFLEFKGHLWLMDSTNYRTKMTSMDEDEAIGRYPDTDTTGIPRVYYLSGDTLILLPYSNDSFTLTGTYYKRLILSVTNTTTWFLTNYPMALVYGALIEAAIYTEDDGRMYQLAYDNEVDKTIQIRIPYYFFYVMDYIFY